MKKILFVLFAGLLINSSQVFAQGCGGDSGGDDDAVKLFGFFQPQYEYHMTDEPENYFKFKRARLGLKGNIPYDFSYYMVMENSAFVSKTGSPYLLDAFISYKRFKWAKISMGSFKQPFGLEVNTACNALYTIDRASVSDQLVSPQRDMGIMILGGHQDSLFSYKVSVMNGTGLLVSDNNKMKDFVGRVTFKPIDFVRIGASFRYGYPLNDEDHRLTYAGDIEVNVGQLKLQGEYIYDEGDWNRAAGGGCGSDPVTLGDKRNGAWAMAMYTIPRFNVQPVAKWEFFDKDMEQSDDKETVISGGFNLFFNDWTRFQIYYRHRMEESMVLNNDEIKVQLQVKF
jgi:hypothetical protein